MTLVVETTRRYRKLRKRQQRTRLLPAESRLIELLALYRQAGSDLGEARARTLDPGVLLSLNDLVGRAYRFVYRRAEGRRAHAASLSASAGRRG